MTDLGSASFKPCTSQAAVQGVDAKTNFRVCSDRPEGRVLSCLDHTATQAIPAIRVRGLGISVQGPALRAVTVASCLHQSREGGPLRERGVHILNYLDDWLILAQSRKQLCAHVTGSRPRGICAGTSQITHQAVDDKETDTLLPCSSEVLK